MTAPPAPPAAQQRRVDGSMSLLVDVMTNTLDEAYAERAARRSSGGGAAAAPSTPAGGLRVRVAGVVAVLLLGMLSGTAIGHVRDRAAASSGIRSDLVDAVRERSSESDRLQREVMDLRAEVTATRDAALGADAAGRAATETVAQLELAAATTAVTGPGVVLTVDDAPAEEPAAPRLRGGSPVDGRVHDRDLQGIVNGLWAAGAEAVSVNGVRLSSRSAIRSAGEAVLVDFRPLSPPYVVKAVGRPADLEVGFVDGPAGRVLQTVAAYSGMRWSLEREPELRLPAATEPDLRAARPVERAQ